MKKRNDPSPIKFGESRTIEKAPAAIRNLLAEPHILPTEDAEAYYAVFDDLVDTYQPTCCQEWLTIKNLQDNIWESCRLSRFNTDIIRSARKGALKTLLRSINNDGAIDLDAMGGIDAASQEATDWFENENVKKAVAKKLSQYDLDEKSIEAQAFIERLSLLEILARLQGSGNVRRRLLLEELESYAVRFVLQPPLAPLVQVSSAETPKRTPNRTPVKV